MVVPEFELLEQTYRSQGADAAFEFLIDAARRDGNYRMLFSARLMQARHRLGLPLVDTSPAAQLSEEQQIAYEKAAQDAARETGQLYLIGGDIPGAWPYFKAIGEYAPVAAALENVTVGENLDRLIEIAFREGVNPRKGFELILEHRGLCNAITWFDANRDYESRRECLKLLVRTLYRDVARALKETIAANEGAAPATDHVAELMAGRAWLFDGNNYYVDSTHLASILRFSPELDDAATLRMAIELADYGNALAPMFHFRGEPPFEEIYLDSGIYLRALAGENVDAAIEHFRAKAAAEPNIPGDTTTAEVLIELLVRLGRYDRAIEASLEFLPPSSRAPAGCPSIAQLCQMSGNFKKLRDVSQERGDLLEFAAGVIQE